MAPGVRAAMASVVAPRGQAAGPLRQCGARSGRKSLLGRSVGGLDNARQARRRRQPVPRPAQASIAGVFDANFRALKFGVKERVETWQAAVRANPSVVAFMAFWSARVMAPAMAVWTVWCAWYSQQMDRYREFLGEETKQEWAWKRHTEKEREVWFRVANFFSVLSWSLLYQGLVPVSFVLSLALPMFISYIVWRNPLWSPIGLSILLISPLKWLPGVKWCWLLPP